MLMTRVLRPFVMSVALAVLLGLGSHAQAQLGREPESAAVGVRLGEPQTLYWQVGTVVRAEQGPVRGLTITIPVPTDWPEQTVKIVEEDFSPHVGNVDYRTLPGNLKQMLVVVPGVDPGQEARAALILEIVVRPVLGPEDPSTLVIPRNPPRDVKKFLGNSPFLNPRHRSVRLLADELLGDDDEANEETDWERIERIYDWVRDNIEQTNDPLANAEQTLEKKAGSAESTVSLFVALCRAAKIPARMVWVPNHQYAEFYLEDEEGNGAWFPCQVVGDREFGSMTEPRPILQRGDNFMVPEKDDPYRFVPELVRGTAGGGRPTVVFLRDQAAAPN